MLFSKEKLEFMSGVLDFLTNGVENVLRLVKSSVKQFRNLHKLSNPISNVVTILNKLL
jgi:hypothetical protein